MKSVSLQKWLPLILLGCLGMFLSEFLIWNPMLQIITRHIPFTASAILRTVIMTTFMYVVLFAMATDIIQRFRIRDAVSLLILGSIYGLILEGIFANKIFEPRGFGPEIFGVKLVHLSFTALSWHPLIDFLSGFLIFKLLLKGKMGLGSSKVSKKELIILMGFGVCWFIWPYAKWYPKNLPQGILFSTLEAVQLLFPMILIGIFLYFVFNKKTGYVPSKILNAPTYGLFIIYILWFAIKRYFSVPNKTSFWFFCAVLLSYVLLIMLYLRYGRKSSETSLYQEGFPISGEFRIVKYMKLSVLLLVFYFVFKYVSVLLGIQGFYLILSMTLAAWMVLGGVLLPILAISKVIYNLLL